MSLTEKIEYTYTIDPKKRVCIREENVILKDDVEVSRTFKRHFLNPGAVISDETEEVQAICNAVWTEEVVKAQQEAEAAHTAYVLSHMATPEEEAKLVGGE